jgi:hypothetical protein
MENQLMRVEPKKGAAESVPDVVEPDPNAAELEFDAAHTDVIATEPAPILVDSQ